MGTFAFRDDFLTATRAVSIRRPSSSGSPGLRGRSASLFTDNVPLHRLHGIQAGRLLGSGASFSAHLLGLEALVGSIYL
jgi:hypothetical protein